MHWLLIIQSTANKLRKEHVVYRWNIIIYMYTLACIYKLYRSKTPSCIMYIQVIIAYPAMCKYFYHVLHLYVHFLHS